MKRIIGALSLLIFISVLFAVLAVGAGAEVSHVYDEAGFLGEQEKAELEARLTEASERTGVTMIVYTTRGVGGADYDNSKLLYKNYVVFAVEYDFYHEEYFYYLDTYGDANSLITDSEVDRILDTPAVYNNIKGAKVYEGLTSIIPRTVTALEGKLRLPVLTALIPSLIVGIIAAAVTAISIYVTYKRKLKSPIYPLEQFTRHKLIVSRDDFAGSFVTMTKRPSSNGGGSRSGSSIGGGGGGGRRGGR